MDNKVFYSLVCAMALTVVVSNILVQFLLGDWLTWAAFTYPVAFLITDITNRLLGTKMARKVVLYGFVTGVLCSLIASEFTTADGFPLTTIRIALGSGLAFLMAQLTDIVVFNSVQKSPWYKAPLLSSVVGSLIDTIVFFTIAFSAAFVFVAPGVDVAWANELVPILGVGVLAPLWVSLAIADFAVKLLLVLVALLPYRTAIKSHEQN